MKLAIGLVAALLATSAQAQIIKQPAGVPSSGGTFTGLITLNPPYAGAGNLSNGLCFNSPSPIPTAQHCFGYGTTSAQAGQLELSTSNSGANVFAVTNSNANGFATVTYRGKDTWYTNPATVFEHLAVGYNAQGSFDQFEFSSFDGAFNPLIPPTEAYFQQTGGVDPTGGVAATCSVTSGSANLTCLSNVGANGTLVSQGTTFLGITTSPTASGIPAATTVVSGGGTTTPVMSAQATATNASQGLIFTTPAYAQYTAIRLYRTGPIIFSNWDNTAGLTIDRIHGRVGINNAFPVTTLDIRGPITVPQIMLTGNLSAASWTTVGPIMNGAGATTVLTDTTGTGTINTEVGASLPVIQIGATNAGVTITNMGALYIPQPVAGTNVTATNRYSIITPGGILSAGNILSTGGLTVTAGTITLGTNGLNINQNASTNTTNLCAGTTSGLCTLGGASNTTKLGSASIQLASGHLWASSTAPSISSGFGSSPSVVANNGTAAFTINVGTGGSATTGVVTMPAATAGWACSVNDVTTTSATVFITKQTATTTNSVTVGNFTTAGIAGAWVASDVLQFMCAAY